MHYNHLGSSEPLENNMEPSFEKEFSISTSTQESRASQMMLKVFNVVKSEVKEEDAVGYALLYPAELARAKSEGKKSLSKPLLKMSSQELIGQARIIISLQDDRSGTKSSTAELTIEVSPPEGKISAQIPLGIKCENLPVRVILCTRPPNSLNVFYLLLS